MRMFGGRGQIAVRNGRRSGIFLRMPRNSAT
jgi:hypothetical protein